MRVSLFQHSLAHGTPDAVFPNNWFTTHPAGEAAGGVAQPTLVFYPLKCPNRCAALSTLSWPCRFVFSPCMHAEHTKPHGMLASKFFEWLVRSVHARRCECRESTQLARKSC